MDKNYTFSEKHFCPDELWDSDLTWHSGVLDFTRCFQLVVFVFVPCLSFCLAAIIKLFILPPPATDVTLLYTPLLFLKMALALTLILNAMLEFCFDVSEQVRNSNISGIEFCGCWIRIVTFILIILTLRHNKIYGIRASPFLRTFLFFFWLGSAMAYMSSLLKVISEEPFTYKHALILVHFPVVFCQFLLSFFPDPFYQPL